MPHAPTVLALLARASERLAALPAEAHKPLALLYYAETTEKTGDTDWAIELRHDAAQLPGHAEAVAFMKYCVEAAEEIEDIALIISADIDTASWTGWAEHIPFMKAG